MIRVLWAASASIRYCLHRYKPTNILLLVILFGWNAMKMVCIGPVSLVLLLRVQLKESVMLSRACSEQAAMDVANREALLGGGIVVVTAAVYTYSARPNPAAHVRQRDACEALAGPWVSTPPRHSRTRLVIGRH